MSELGYHDGSAPYGDSERMDRRSEARTRMTTDLPIDTVNGTIYRDVEKRRVFTVSAPNLSTYVLRFLDGEDPSSERVDVCELYARVVHGTIERAAVGFDTVDAVGTVERRSDGGA